VVKMPVGQQNVFDPAAGFFDHFQYLFGFKARVDDRT
jgi:hypothetical protein